MEWRSREGQSDCPWVSEDAARVMIMKRGRIRGLVFYDHIWYEQKGLGSYYMETSVYKRLLHFTSFAPRKWHVFCCFNRFISFYS